jgi:hypothetical protein
VAFDSAYAFNKALVRDGALVPSRTVRPVIPGQGWRGQAPRPVFDRPRSSVPCLRLRRNRRPHRRARSGKITCSYGRWASAAPVFRILRRRGSNPGEPRSQRPASRVNPGANYLRVTDELKLRKVSSSYRLFSQFDEESQCCVLKRTPPWAISRRGARRLLVREPERLSRSKGALSGCDGRS